MTGAVAIRHAIAAKSAFGSSWSQQPSNQLLLSRM